MAITQKLALPLIFTKSKKTTGIVKVLEVIS